MKLVKVSIHQKSLASMLVLLSLSPMAQCSSHLRQNSDTITPKVCCKTQDKNVVEGGHAVKKNSPSEDESKNVHPKDCCDKVDNEEKKSDNKNTEQPKQNNAKTETTKEMKMPLRHCHCCKHGILQKEFYERKAAREKKEDDKNSDLNKNGVPNDKSDTNKEAEKPKQNNTEAKPVTKEEKMPLRLCRCHHEQPQRRIIIKRIEPAKKTDLNESDAKIDEVSNLDSTDTGTDKNSNLNEINKNDKNKKNEPVMDFTQKA